MFFLSFLIFSFFQLLSFVWIVVLSIPVGLDGKKRRKLRNKIIQSPFYTNTAATLGGVAFLPIVFGLLLPMSCRNSGSSSNNTTNATSTFTSSSTPSSTPSSMSSNHMICWESSHSIVVAMAIEFLYVVLLTNVGVNVSEYSEDVVARSAKKAKDTGLDVVYASSFTSGVKLLQVLMLFFAALGASSSEGGSLPNASNHANALLLFVVLGIVLVLWTPLYYIVIGKFACCCFKKGKEDAMMMNVVASVPSVPTARSFGFVAILLTAILLYLKMASIAYLSTALIGCVVVGIIVAFIVRRLNYGERKEFLDKIGLTAALKDLTKTENELFQDRAFDAAWATGQKQEMVSYNNSDATNQSIQSLKSIGKSAPAREMWLQRVKLVQSARSMGQCVLEFERHILAENLDEAFMNEREVWKARLNMDVSVLDDEEEEEEEEEKNEDPENPKQPSTRELVVGNGLNFTPIVHGLKSLRNRLRPPTMTHRVMDLVRIRVRAAHMIFYKRGLYNGSSVWVNDDKSQGSSGGGSGGKKRCIFGDGGKYIAGKCSKCGHLHGVSVVIELNNDISLRSSSNNSDRNNRNNRNGNSNVQFVDPNTKRSQGNGSNGGSNSNSGNKRTVRLPRCNENPSGQVYSTILSFIGAEVLSDLRETPFVFSTLTSRLDQRQPISSMAKKWRDDILQHDSKIANQSASKYLYPADLWSWLHAPTFASQRNSSITDFLNPYYNVTESKLTKQVECAQRVIAHVAVAVAKLEDERKQRNEQRKKTRGKHKQNANARGEHKGEGKGKRNGERKGESKTNQAPISNMKNLFGKVMSVAKIGQEIAQGAVNMIVDQTNDSEEEDPFNKWTCEACTFENQGCTDWKYMDQHVLDSVVMSLSNCTVCESKRKSCSDWLLKVKKIRSNRTKYLSQQALNAYKNGLNQNNSSASSLSTKDRNSHFNQLVQSSDLGRYGRNEWLVTSREILNTRIFLDADQVYCPTEQVEAVGVDVDMSSSTGGRNVVVAQKVAEV